MRTRAFRVSLLFVACSSKVAPPPTSAEAAAAVVEAPVPVPPNVPARAVGVLAAGDTPVRTLGGSTLQVPAGWMIYAESNPLKLASPDNEVELGIVETTEQTTDAAVMEAWRRFSNDSERPLKIAQARPPRQGWSERRVYIYETSPNEKEVATAIALRSGDTWTVLLMAGSEAGFEKRAAQVNLVASSIRPGGYQRESFAGKQPRVLDEAAVKSIIDMVERARVAGDVPGVGLALVQNGEVVYSGGLGARELGKATPVDEHTRFMIASNTKALTTFALAKLVDEGRFGWETPVTQIYPKFALGSPDVTRQVLVKHLICACTGLPRQDLEWLLQYESRRPDSVMALLATMQPTSKFGEVFQYSNMMAAAAGFVGGASAYPTKELGAAYDTLMQTRLFGPLGMSETTLDFKKALAANHASPHGVNIDGKTALAAIDLNYAVVSARPAGGAWSSARDLARYVQLELAKGALPDGTRDVSEESLAARQVPQIAVGEDMTYGMGLFVDKQYGTPVVRHGGSLIGYQSDMFCLPEAGVGGVILTNADTGALLRRPFVRRVLEVLFDGRDEAEEDAMSAIAQFKERVAKERERLVSPPDATEAKKLGSRYMNDALGSLAVRQSAGTVVFDFGEWKSAVASRKNDDGTTSFITIDPGEDGFELVVGEQAGRRTLTIRDAQHEYVFTEGKPSTLQR